MIGDNDESFPIEAAENMEDAAEILADQDQTRDPLAFERDVPRHRLANNLEDEPEDFIEGDVDVVTQMIRTERQLRSHLDGGNSDRGRHEDDRIPNK